MFAVERVSWRRYAMCRLAEWVDEDDLFWDVRRDCSDSYGESKRPRRNVSIPPRQVKGSERDWWQDAAMDVPSLPHVLNANDSSTQPLPQLRMIPPSGATPKAEQRKSEADVRSSANKPATNHVGAMPKLPTVHIQQSQDATQELTKQYLDTLYLSRTSLAYFTKGPLSRARAACSAVDVDGPKSEGYMSTSDLVEFLRQSVLGSATLDKKYRDGVAGIINDLPVRAQTDDLANVPKRKKKRKWKPKRDKIGFFVDEQDFVERWWLETDIDLSPTTETADAVMRRRVMKIRIRETFLQIILCLEVLALEGSLPVVDRNLLQTNLAAIESQRAEETQLDDTQASSAAEKSTKKPKKKQDLAGLLESLLDKLTIWSSLESHSPVKSRADSDRTDMAQASDSNELRNFCIEVIVPFYVSRVPQHATTVNRKLGGPSPPSPRRKVSSKHAKSVVLKPGEPASRQPPPQKKPRQPLARTSTETDDAHDKQRHSMPTLQRSATDTDALLSHIKRETSESLPDLDTIPPLKAIAKTQHRSRPSLMSSLSRREVDFTALSAASEAKLKKKADVEEKLREAISTLKKPNRAAAVREVAENADASFAKALAKGKTQQKSLQTATAGDAAKDDKTWLIAATPSRHARSTKRVKGTPYRDHTNPYTHAGDAAPSSGSSAIVPSSSARLKDVPQAKVEPPPSNPPAIPVTGHRPRYHHLQVPKVASAVEETPSRGFARFMPAGLAREPGTLESPIATRKAAIEHTPSKSIKFNASVPMGISSTPLRRPTSAPLVEASPNIFVLNGRDADDRNGKSLYATLGWDDDEYEQLA